MKARGFERFLAGALAVTMVFGGAFASFADDNDTQAATDGIATGEGSYEGGEMKYPTLSVTLPTIPDGTYDYIADPNGLIDATSNARYEDSVFNGNTGVFFLTTKAADSTDNKNQYTEKSAAQSVTNENAQDIDVTVKLEQTEAGSTEITYSDTATFESTDTANKLYLAVTDDAEEDPNISALSSEKAATVSATVAGKPDNFEANYDGTDGYGFVKKSGNDLEWNSCSFLLTGALNKSATWGDDMSFPTIKVTWTYAEHEELSITLNGSYSRTNTANKFTLSGLGTAAIEKVEALDGSNAVFAEMTTAMYTFDADTSVLTVDGTKAPWGSGAVGNTRGIKITLDNGETLQTTFTVTQ